MSEIKYKSYDSTIDNFETKLQQNGVVVIPDILNHEECKQYRNEIWEELKYVMKNRFDISKPKHGKNSTLFIHCILCCFNIFH